MNQIESNRIAVAKLILSSLPGEALNYLPELNCRKIEVVQRFDHCC